MALEDEKKLAADYTLYCLVRDQWAAQGKALGTFIGWQYPNNKVGIKIAKTWDKHVRNTRKSPS